VPAGSAPIEVSVLVPCFNEEGNLPELVERTERVFARRRISGEIVLVNDGSIDGTAAQIEALAARFPNVVAVHHPTNRGISAAWRSAFDRSRGRYVCTIDADLQYQPEAIALLHREMRFSQADLVQAWRSTLERQHDHRYLMSRGLDYALKLAFGMPEHDVKSGFVLYKREVFEDILQETGRFHYFQHMITVVAKAKGYSIRQVETLFDERHAGESFIGGFPARMIVRTWVDIGRAFLAYRLREPRDQSLTVALRGHPAPAPRTAPRVRWRARRAGEPAISRNAAAYLDELRRTQWLSRDELAELQVRRLRRLVQHANDHVGYWREVLRTAGVTADDLRTLDDLRRIPSLTKHALRDNIYFDLVSDSSHKPKLGRITTSGSTGEPLALYVDRVHLDTRCANTMRHQEWAGWRPGDAQVRLWHPPAAARGDHALRDRLRAALGSRGSVATDVIDRELVRYLDERLRRERPALLVADAEVLHLVVARLGADAPRLPAVRAVVSTGQTLAPDVRVLVERVAGAPVFDRYAARELGPIAQECEAHGLHVNAESVIVEIERDGRPAAEGEVGEVLVTDLTNGCVPLLRYRLGDRAVASTRRCPCGRGLPLLERVVGRAEGAVVGAGGRQIPAGFFADLFADYEFAVRRYQVVQPARDRLEVRIVRKSRFIGETERALRAQVGRVLGDGIAVGFSFVDEIRAEAGGEPQPCVSEIEASACAGEGDSRHWGVR
jgi:phenylacetate-CoA ligase